MGSWFFQERWDGADPDAGFKALHEDDLRSHGDDPYTGTLGQKSGFTRLATKPVSKVEAERLADDFSDKSDKYDDYCGAIPLAGRKGKPRRSKPAVRAATEREAKRLLRERFGDELVRIITLKPKRPPHSGKVVATKHEVKPRIVWTINGKGEYPNKTAASKAAREKAKAFAAKAKAGGRVYYSSEGEFFVAPAVKVDGDQTAALALKVALNDKPVAWEVEVELQKADATKPGAWLFVGWARE